VKIVHVISGLSVGGAETQLAAVSRGLADRGHDVSIVCMGGPGQVSIDPRIALHYLGIVKTPFSIMVGFIRFCRLISQLRPDIVHSHMIHANLFSRLGRLFYGAGHTINSVHSIHETNSRAMEWAYRLSNPLASLVVFVSEAAAESYVSKKLVPPRNVAIIHNGIDLGVFKFEAGARDRIRRSLAISTDARVVVSVGRFVESKNFKGLLAAVRPLLADGTVSNILLVGDGPLKLQLERCCAADPVLAAAVKFVGSVPNVADHLSAGDVFLLLSKTESFGLAVAEAMACERVVVAADTGGVREVIGRDGYLVHGDRKAEVESVLRRVLDLAPMERAMCGSAGRERVFRNFSIEATVRHWENMYAR
jgi:glycosyltransferase involved in cell wall biosynthesis